jgi:hypothetical protein
MKSKHLTIHFLPFLFLYVQNYLLEMIKKKSYTGHKKHIKLTSETNGLNGSMTVSYYWFLFDLIRPESLSIQTDSNNLNFSQNPNLLYSFMK